jgi:O-antigen ligase
LDIPEFILFIFFILTWIYIYRTAKSLYGKSYAFIKLLFLSLPYSYINIWGGDYSSFPLSWFWVFLLGLFLINFFKSRFIIDFSGKIALLIAIGAFIPFLISYDYFDGFKQYINIIAFCISFIIGTSLKINWNIDKIKDIIFTYAMAALSASLGLFIQIYIFLSIGKIIGKIDFMASRIGFGFIFSDYSFLSLFLASASGILIDFFEKNKNLREKSIFSRIFLIFLFMIASLLTSARTGIVSFFIASIIIYNLYFSNILSFSFKKIIVGIIILFILLILIYGLPRLRGDIFSSSGRIESYILGLQIFRQNPVWGCGLGVRSYKERFGYTIPHNVIIQYLSQTGLLLTILILILLFDIIKKAWKIKISSIFITLLTIMIGSLFIPDILNSRFLIALNLIINSLYYSQKRGELLL